MHAYVYLASLMVKYCRRWLLYLLVFLQVTYDTCSASIRFVAHLNTTSASEACALIRSAAKTEFSLDILRSPLHAGDEEGTTSLLNLLKKNESGYVDDDLLFYVDGGALLVQNEESEIRRALQHISFTPSSVAFGLSRNYSTTDGMKYTVVTRAWAATYKVRFQVLHVDLSCFKIQFSMIDCDSKFPSNLDGDSSRSACQRLKRRRNSSGRVREDRSPCANEQCTERSLGHP